MCTALSECHFASPFWIIIKNFLFTIRGIYGILYIRINTGGVNNE